MINVTYTPSLVAIPWRTGKYYGSMFGTTLAGVAGIGVGNISFTPLLVPQSINLKSLAVYMTIVGTGLVHMGLYSNSEGYPSDLLTSGSPISNATTGVVTAPIWYSATPGLYWLAAVGSTTAGQMLAANASFGWRANSNYASAVGTQSSGYSILGSSSILPDVVSRMSLEVSSLLYHVWVGV